MRLNKVETADYMSHRVLAGFSGRVNTIYNI